MTEKSTQIAFIGTGVMGASMARHLLESGYSLTVHNRTRKKAEALIQAGATWADTPGQAAQGADAVFTIVGFPHDVRQVYLDPGGIVENTKNGALLCDMTTSDPSLAIEIAEAAQAKGALSLDAPVSGGDIGAREARLTIMCGGADKAFESARPLLEIMGKNIVHQGESGAGQHTKMCNQIAIASTMIGMTESLLYAKAAGLDPETVLQSIGAGAAGSWSLTNLAPRVIKGDFEAGFFVRHFIKDMDIALRESERLGLAVPGLKLARQLYEKVVELGGENLGTQALYLALEKMR